MRTTPPDQRLTASLDEEHQRALDRIGAYLLATGTQGWIEYWFWDVIEGRRPWPFWLDVDESIRSDMLALRNGPQVWFTWSFTRRAWQPVHLHSWLGHVKKYGVLEAQNRCDDLQKKVGRGKE